MAIRRGWRDLWISIIFNRVVCIMKGVVFGVRCWCKSSFVKCDSQDGGGRRRNYIRRSPLLIPLLLAVGLLSVSSSAAVRTWTGTVSSDWFNAGNWSPQGVPAAADTAIVTGGTPSLSKDTTVASFELQNGT